MTTSRDRIPLSDVLTLQRGFDLPTAKRKPGYVPVVASTSIASFHSEAKVKGPGVVIGRSGSIGGGQFIADDFWPLNTTLWVKDFKGHNRRFAYYLLRSIDFSRFNAGAGVPTLNRNHIATLFVPYFSPGQEERIADILSAYDDLIENNRRRIQLLEQAARLLYKEWFVHLRFPGHERVKIKDGVPEGWEKVPLSRLCYDARVSVKPRDVPGDTPYVGIEHIPRHSITLSDWSFASKVKSNKFRFEAGDILFGKIRPYFHKVGFSLTNGITSSDVIVIRPVEHSLYLYCLFLLSSDEFVGLASKTVREGSKMPRADWKFLLRFQFLLPCRVLVQAFTEFTTEIIPQLKTLALQNHQLAEARDLLLPRLMSGEIAI